MKGRKQTAVEVRRLARLRELARDKRRAERNLQRAIVAASARGIGVRPIAEATGLAGATVWRLVRSHNGHGPAGQAPNTPAKAAAKPKTAKGKGVAS